MLVNHTFTKISGLQLSVVSHCGVIRLGMQLGYMKVDAAKLINLVEESLSKLIA